MLFFTLLHKNIGRAKTAEIFVIYVIPCIIVFHVFRLPVGYRSINQITAVGTIGS